MSENLKIWNAAEETDPKFTKAFSRGGGFKGTATNATYLAKRATETFGPCGIGWGVKLLNEEIIDGSPLVAERVHKVHVCFWYMLDGKRGEIEQFGQTTIVGKNRNGPFMDEEAPKKSMTDAMTKAMSLLGFAADIHMGRYDDVKYVSDLKDKFSDEARQPDEPTGPDESVSVYVAQALKRIAWFTLAPSLKKWWEDDAVVRRELGIVNGSPEYSTLFEMFKARGLALSSASTTERAA